MNFKVLVLLLISALPSINGQVVPDCPPLELDQLGSNSSTNPNNCAPGYKGSNCTITNCDVDGCLECSCHGVCERCEEGKELTSEKQCQASSSERVIVGKDIIMFKCPVILCTWVLPFCRYSGWGRAGFFSHIHSDSNNNWLFHGAGHKEENGKP